MCVLYTIRQCKHKLIPVRITASVEAVGEFRFLMIASRGVSKRYLIDELEVDDATGRRFALLGDEPDAHGYSVFIGAGRLDLDRCNCDGGRFLKRCKHADALRAMVDGGEI